MVARILQNMENSGPSAMMWARTNERLHRLEHQISELRGHVARLNNEAGYEAQRMVECDQPVISMADIFDAVCEYYKVPRAQMLGPRRARAIARPRQVFCWLCRELTVKSTGQIGRYLARDHTTVCHAEQTITKLRKCDPDLKRSTDALRRDLLQGHEESRAA